MDWTTVIRRQIAWPALELEQARLVAQVQANPSVGYLLVSEPLPTFTHGRTGLPADCRWSPDELAQRGIAVHEVSRGGKWTYHGPGQIVVYPIVSLESLGYSRRGIRRFLSDLRRAVSGFLREQGVDAQEGEGPFGLFVDGKKLTSFGLAVRRGIASHGLALYLKPQGEWFTGINPCGVPDGQTSSLEEQGHVLSWERAAAQLADFIKSGLKNGKSW